MQPIRKVQYFKSYNPKETAFMEKYRLELRDLNQPDSLQHIFVPFDSISPFLKSAVLAAEDDGFYTHPGIDVDAILQASEYNRSHGEFKRGGSTITQQLAKNLFLSKEKSFQRKAMELAFALLMEHYLGKQRIFELYLNYAQWGKNIFGCEAASQFYFKKSSKDLNRMEAALLAAVLAMPSKLTPFHKTMFMNKRISTIATNLYYHKTIDAEAYFGMTGTIPPSKDSTSVPVERTRRQDSAERTSF